MKKAYMALAALAVFASGCLTTGLSSERAVIRAKERVAPALVHIRPVKELFRRGKRREMLVIGSGFIISPDGYVVTNEHVAGKSKHVRCVLSNKDEVEAEVVGVDPFTDIAVLKLVTDRTDLPFVTLGDSSRLKAGQTVLAMGSPHGLARSVSRGIVSVTDRYLESSGASVSPYNTWIQTDAAINPGNSGGPLVNLKGEVIGINTRKLRSADNVGFAIPINVAREVIEAIMRDGRVSRSAIGVRLQEMTRFTEDASRKGVIIADVDPFSPASAARIRPSDILLAVNGVATDARFVEDLPAIRKRIADVPVGDTAYLQLLREGQRITLAIKTVEESQLSGDEIEFEEWGFTASELTPQVIRMAQLTSKRGVVVTGTQVGGVAANAGLKAREIILTVDGERVDDLAAFEALYDSLVETRKRLVLLEVKRGALTRFVLVKQQGDSEAEAEGEGDDSGDG